MIGAWRTYGQCSMLPGVVCTQMREILARRPAVHQGVAVCFFVENGFKEVNKPQNKAGLPGAPAMARFAQGLCFHLLLHLGRGGLVR